MKIVITMLSVLALAFLVACGGEKKAEDAPPPPQKEVVIVEVTGNDQMQFNVKTIEVPAGSTVKVNFKHIGQMPKETMGHNFIILKADVDLTAFATAAIAAKDSEYIPADKKDQILASTKLLGGGESTSIEFEAPAAGTYKFLCSFPGHYALMQGDFIVK